MVECFSRIESARCQGLSDTQNIIVFLPSGLSLLLVPILLALTWKTPRATIILLAIALLLNGTVDTWNLVTQLVPLTPVTFRSQDVALGAISSLPSVFFLLFVTSFLVSDLRQTLPSPLQTNLAALLFTSIVLPLVPTSFGTSLLGNVLFIGYFFVGQSIELGFERSRLRDIHDTLATVGIATATGFVAIAFVLAMLVLLNTKSRARWVAEFRSVPALCLFTVGLLLASLDLVLAVARESFVGILVRRILETASQVLLTIGLVGSYYPLPLVDRVGSSSGGRKTPSKAAQAQPRQSAGKPQRPSRPSIGQPVTGSFHRMSHAATRSFHTAHGERRQKGQDDDWNKEDSKQHDRVLMRTQPHRAPKLSFTPSTFDQSDLATLADDVRDRERLIQQSIAMNEELTGGNNPFSSPEEQRERYLQVKQYTSSSYRPSLVPVVERDGSGSPTRPTVDKPIVASDWPMPPGLQPRSGLIPWTNAAQRNSVASRASRNHRLGQVSAYKTVEQLHPTPPSRSNSAKRKPVPEHDVEPEKSIAGDLSFISLESSTETQYAGASSPTIPSPASATDEAGPSSRPGRRRDTDPANAMVVPRSPDQSSTYSQSTDQPDDRGLFFREPMRSPSSSSPAESTTQSPRVSVVPPSRTSHGDGWDEDRPDMAMALSSLARVRRDTGVDLPNQSRSGLEGQERLSGGSRNLTLDRDALERDSTITWTSEDLTPRASERGWWSAGIQDT